MKYLISSHFKYYTDTYPVIIQSLLDAKIDVKDIIMVVGGCPMDTILNNPLNIQLVPVEYNSFDLTALIYAADILENLDTDHVFLMHDTCLVGPKFKNLVMDYHPNDIIKTLRSAISMNIGLYSKYILEKNKSNLNQLKFYPETEQEVQHVKEFFVVNEDIVFKSYPYQCYTNYYVSDGRANFTLDELKDRFNKEPYLSYIKKLQNSNIKREIGYGTELDFYKLQANTNWGGLWKIGV
jgi:hypothetical protein